MSLLAVLSIPSVIAVVVMLILNNTDSRRIQG